MILELQKSTLRQVILGYIFTYKATKQECYKLQALEAYKLYRSYNVIALKAA